MRVALGVIVIIFLLSSSAWSQEKLVKLTLDQSIEQALKGNLDLKIAKVQLQKMKSEIAQKEASFRLKANLEAAPISWAGKVDKFNFHPEASLSANLLTKSGTTYSFNITEEKEGSEGLKTTSLSLILTQKIFPHPRLNSSYLSLEKAGLNLRKSELSLEEEKNCLRLGVIRSFYNILKQKREIEIKKLSLEQAKENLIMIEDKLRKGLANELDLLNAQIKVANAQDALSQSRNQLTKELTEFKGLLGIDPRLEVELIEESEYEFEPLKMEFDQAVEEALENRAEIKQQKLTIQTCQLDLALAKSKFSPSLNIAGGYTYSYGDTLPRTEKEEYKASLIFEIPLLDGGESKAEIQGVQTKLKESELNLEKLKRDITAEVQNCFLDLQEKERQIEILKLSEKRCRRDLSIAQERFSKGSITKDELREKEINFKQAQIELLDTLLDYELARLTFLRSLGRKL